MQHLTAPQPMAPTLQRKRSFSNRTRQTISQAQHQINYSRFSAIQSLKTAVHKLGLLVNSQPQSNDMDDLRSYLSTRPSTAHNSPPRSIMEPDEYDSGSDESTIHSCEQVPGIIGRETSCACGRMLPCWVHA